VVGAVAAGAAAGGLAVVVAHAPLAAAVGTGTLAVALVSVQRLDLGLFFLLAFTYARVFEVGSRDHGLPSLRLPFAVGLIVLALLSARDLDKLGPAVVTRALAAFAAYGAVLFLSVFWAKDGSVALSAVVAYGKDMVIVLAVFVLITTPSALRLAVWAIVVAALALAALSVLQYTLQAFGQTFFGFAKAPIQNIVGEYNGPRVAGPLGAPNYFAQMLLIAVPLGLERALHAARHALRVLGLASALACGAAIFLTFSRGGFFGLVVILALILLRYRPKIVPLVVAAVVVFAIAASSSPYVARVSTINELIPGQSPKTGQDVVIHGRDALAKIAVRMFSDHPVTGVGYGNYAVRYNAYNRSVGADPAVGTTPHDLVLEVAAETGVLGLAAWGALLFLALRSLARTRRWAQAVGSVELAGLVEALFIAIVGYQVTALFAHGAYPIFYWLLLALALVCERFVVWHPSITTSGAGGRLALGPSSLPG
jgi:O-antigen ligase